MNNLLETLLYCNYHDLVFDCYNLQQLIDKLEDLKRDVERYKRDRDND